MRQQLSAMVLAAGHATRLRPLTDDLAKAVVPFLNRPLLDYTLQWLAEEGFDRVVINLHHAGHSIRDHYGEQAFGLRLQYSPEEVLLGTAGGPRRALPLLGSRILLVNGDVLARVNLDGLLRRHADSGALATLGLYDDERARGYPQVIANANGRLLAFPGDPPPASAAVRGVFTGIHVLERRVLEALPDGVVTGIVDPVYRSLLRAGEILGAVRLDGFWYEVGDPARYLAAQLDVLRRCRLPLAVASSRQLSAAGWAAASASLPTGALGEPFLLGEESRLAPGCRAAGVVLGDGAIIESNSEVSNAVLWNDSRVGSGCRLRDVVVMRGVTVAAGTHATRTVFAENGAHPFPPVPGELS